MQRCSAFHKKELHSAGVNVGVSVVPTSVSSFSYSKADSNVITTSTVHAKKIPLLDIRKKLLRKHENLGIIRNCESPESSSTRHCKVWHDHSSSWSWLLFSFSFSDIMIHPFS